MLTGENITEELILDIINSMSLILGSEELIKLKDVLYMKLIKYNIEFKDNNDELTTIDNDNINMQILRNFRLSKELDGKSTKTTQRYEDILRPVLFEINKPISDITTDDLQQYLWKYKEIRKVCNNTLDGMRRIMSSFFTWCRIKKYIKEDPSEGLQRIKSPKKVKKIITDEELEKIRIHCDNDRDIAMVDLFYASGIRVSELSELNINDVNFVEKSLKVHGKGNKERVVYFDGRTKVRLEKYLATRTDNNPALFVTLISDRHTLQPRRFKVHTIETRIKEIGMRSGIEHIYPHKLRHKFATDLVHKGMPVEKVSHLLGHENLETTKIYVDISDSDAKNSYLQYVG